MNDSAHYLHDVIAGAVIRATYGLGICLKENQRAEESENRKISSWYLAPTVGGASAGVTLTY